MKVYLVGGAVRDKLLGVEVKDKDYVVVGSSPEEMLSLGYKQVGCDFPVFLHPETGEEYALARTEKKEGVGYQGFNCNFSPDVTLEEDLSRRDLTINAMAIDLDVEDNSIFYGSHEGLIDPFGGLEDLNKKRLRATTEAFKDDPVRVLRLARFMARLGPKWKVEGDTWQYCRKLVKNEFEMLTAERVFKELEKALSEPYPALFFNFLQTVDGFYPWFIPVGNLTGVMQPIQHHPEMCTYVHTMMALQQGVKIGCTPKELFAILCHDFGKFACMLKRGNLLGHEEAGVELINGFCDRLKVPSEWRDLAVKVCRYHTHCHKAFELKPKTVMKLFEGLDCIRKPEILFNFVECCEADARGRAGFENRDYPQAEYLLDCQARVLAVSTKQIAEDMLAKGKEGKAIGEEIRVQRIKAIGRVEK
jgi:tRNA nucleotidyltransferase (CCA-adding enzyme)